MDEIDTCIRSFFTKSDAALDINNPELKLN